MSVFTLGRRAGTARRLFPAEAGRLAIERSMVHMTFNHGFWHRVGTASGRCRSNPGLCHPGVVDLT